MIGYIYSYVLSLVGHSIVNNRIQYLKQDVFLAYNCWRFAWEFLLQADNKDVKAMMISTADPTSAWKAIL